MTAMTNEAYRLGELHPFNAAGCQFLYLPPSGAMFQIDEAADALLEGLAERPKSHLELIEGLVAGGYRREDADELLRELYFARVIVSGQVEPAPLDAPPRTSHSSR